MNKTLLLLLIASFVLALPAQAALTLDFSFYPTSPTSSDDINLTMDTTPGNYEDHYIRWYVNGQAYNENYTIGGMGKTVLQIAGFDGAATFISYAEDNTTFRVLMDPTGSAQTYVWNVTQNGTLLETRRLATTKDSGIDTNGTHIFVLNYVTLNNGVAVYDTNWNWIYNFSYDNCSVTDGIAVSYSGVHMAYCDVDVSANPDVNRLMYYYNTGDPITEWATNGSLESMYGAGNYLDNFYTFRKWKEGTGTNTVESTFKRELITWVYDEGTNGFNKTGIINMTYWFNTNRRYPFSMDTLNGKDFAITANDMDDNGNYVFLMVYFNSLNSSYFGRFQTSPEDNITAEVHLYNGTWIVQNFSVNVQALPTTQPDEFCANSVSSIAAKISIFILFMNIVLLLFIVSFVHQERITVQQGMMLAFMVNLFIIFVSIVLITGSDICATL